MKKRTLVAAGISLFLCSFIAGMQLSTPDLPTMTDKHPTASFNNVQIGEGIEIEFEYGTQLQVIRETNQLQAPVRMLLHDQTLVITALSADETSPVKFKVITPGLVSLEKLQAPAETQLVTAGDTRDSMAL